MQHAHEPFKRQPLYLQVRDSLIERIKVGGWRPGFPLPNENALAQEYNVSSGTMRKALDLLEYQRLVVRRQGRGTFVREHIDFESVSDATKEFMRAIGAAVSGATLVMKSGKTYDANGLRLVADGLVECAAWMDQQPAQRSGRKAA